jgi:hypothetical protein
MIFDEYMVGFFAVILLLAMVGLAIMVVVYFRGW